MKSIKKIYKLFTLLVFGVIVISSSCKKEDLDMPPFIEPIYTLSAGDTLITIAELKAMHTGGTLDSIKNNYFIKGVITGNDEFGNIYKSLYIQDLTGGIILTLNAKDLYTKYKQGQTIYVKCKNLVYGYYGGTPQLGGVYGGSIGQLAEAAIPNHLFKTGYPVGVPAPVAVNVAADLTLVKVSTLIRIDSATFADAGQPYVTGNATTNRTVVMNDGTSIIIRTSAYATFKDVILPSGKGTIIAILGNYNGTYQLLLRNTNDVFGFSSK